MEWSRLHNRSRRSLFTPMSLAQGPAEKTHLMRLRRTKGIGLLTMRRLCITVDWTQTYHSHRLFDEPWIGTTTLREVADCMVELEDSTMTADDDDSSGQPGAQRSEPTMTGAITAATIFIVDGQPGARRSEPTAIRGHGSQTSTGKDIGPSLEVLRSSLDGSHDVSKEVGGCGCGTDHLCSDGCGPCNRRSAGRRSPRRMRVRRMTLPTGGRAPAQRAMQE